MLWTSGTIFFITKIYRFYSCERLFFIVIVLIDIFGKFTLVYQNGIIVIYVCNYFIVIFLYLSLILKLCQMFFCFTYNSDRP
jgi:hypothetical protein